MQQQPKLGWVILYVEDIARSLDFYTAALGLTIRFRTDDYAELDTGATALAVCSRSALAATSTGLPAEQLVGNGMEITLVYDDPEAAFAHAVANGAVPRKAPELTPWGQWVSYVQDPDGHLVELASAVDAP